MTPKKQTEMWLADIIADPLFQVRTALDPKTVARYVDVRRAGCGMPRVRVMVVNGAPMLVDGWHRVEAAKRLGEATIAAEITEGTEADLRWAAAEANIAHGLQLKKAERRNVLRAYVEAGKHLARGRKPKSAREIGRDIGGVSHVTILKWLRTDFPHVHRAIASGQLEDNGRRTPEETGSLEDRREAEVRAALAKAEANSRGVKDPRRRGEIVAQIEALLDKVKTVAAFEVVEMEIEDF